MFVDPYVFLFNNITGVPMIDINLIETCAKGFTKDIIESLSNLSTTTQMKHKRDGGITAIIALSALFVSSYSAVSTSSMAKRDNTREENCGSTRKINTINR